MALVVEQKTHDRGFDVNLGLEMSFDFSCNNIYKNLSDFLKFCWCSSPERVFQDVIYSFYKILLYLEIIANKVHNTKL